MQRVELMKHYVHRELLRVLRPWTLTFNSRDVHRIVYREGFDCDPFSLCGVAGIYSVVLVLLVFA